MTIFNSENIHFSLSRKSGISKGLEFNMINPWQTSESGRGFFISTNSRRFTHPRPTQKIGYQIGVLGMNRIG